LAPGTKILNDGSHRIPGHIPERGHGFLFLIEADVRAIGEGKIEGGMEGAGRSDLFGNRCLNGRGTRMMDKVSRVHE
jgi:hypothetical protein